MLFNYFHCQVGQHAFNGIVKIIKTRFTIIRIALITNLFLQCKIIATTFFKYV